MNRIQQREQAFFLLFQNQFHMNDESTDNSIELYSENVEEVGDYAKELYNGVIANQNELDEIIASFSNGWKIARIPKVNLAILRLAIYEMKFVENVPDSVAINEAVELCKKYASKEDSSFVNGILGSFSRSSK